MKPPIPSSLPGAEAAARHGRILVLDDDDILRSGLSGLLRAFGHEPVQAVDGPEALALLDARPCDAILSDIHLPGMSGMEFLKEVRGRNLDVPVLLMTGDPRLETAIHAIEYGATSYLTKPIDAERLSAAIGRALRLHGLAQLKRQALTMTGQLGHQLGDRAALEVRFESALASLWPAFQPIVTVPTRRVFAYEALLRSTEPTLPRPMDVIEAAERLGRPHDLGQAMRRRVAERADTIPGDILLFVNLHHDDLLDPQLFDPTAPLSRHARRVVLEITERAALDHLSDLGPRIGSLRALGYRIAIDDLGAGYAGLTSLVRLEPEVVKIDMALVRGVDKDATRATVIQHIVGLCGEIGMAIIAEGIETVAERDALVRLGCHLHQGYLYGRPAAEPGPADFGDVLQ